MDSVNDGCRFCSGRGTGAQVSVPEGIVGCPECRRVRALLKDERERVLKVVVGHAEYCRERDNVEGAWVLECAAEKIKELP